MLIQKILQKNGERRTKWVIKSVPFPGSKLEEREDMSVKNLPKGTVLRYAGVVQNSPTFFAFTVVSCPRQELVGLRCWLSPREVVEDTTP